MSIFQKFFGGAIAAVVLSGTVAAAEPVRLSDADLDSVAASGFAGFALAFTGGTFALGNGISVSESSSSSYIDRSVTTPTSFTPNIQASAQTNISVQAFGVGATAAGGSGGLSVGVFPF